MQKFTIYFKVKNLGQIFESLNYLTCIYHSFDTYISNLLTIFSFRKKNRIFVFPKLQGLLWASNQLILIDTMCM